MSPIRVTTLLALCILAPISIAHGQAIFGGGNAAANPTSNQGSATERAVPQCQGAPGGSRMRRRDQGGCQEIAEATAQAEQQLKVSLDVPAPDAIQCEATTSTQYSQRNTVARVEGSVSIANCPAGSAGTFDVVARIKDESGEIKPIEFAEKWQRDGAGDAPFGGDYPIGENVELMNVRVRNLKCTCAEAPEAAPAETAQPN